MSTIKKYLEVLDNYLFIHLSREDEYTLINNNFISNIFKFSLYGIIAGLFQSALLIYYLINAINDNSPYSTTYITMTFVEILLFFGFPLFCMCSYNKGSLTLKKQKIVSYLFLLFYLAIQTYFISNDFGTNGFLVGFYFDLLFIGIIPVFHRKITYLYAFGYSIFLTIVIVTFQEEALIAYSNSLIVCAGFLSFLGFYLISGYIRNNYIKAMFFQNESNRMALLRESDNMKLFALNKKLQSLTTTDELTNIANRRAFDNYINKIWYQCFREKRLVTIFMIDIDDFKKYNDNFGHQNGDKVLYSVSQAMSDALRRKDDLLARYGGEEFIAVLPYTRENNIVELANNMINNVAALEIKTPSECKRKYVSVSIGIATCIPSTEISAAELIIRADKALYLAKSGGKNCYEFYNEDKL